MYAGKSRPVPIPSVGDHGKLLIQKNGYIYYVTESHWDKEKKRTVDNRVGIGKIDPNHAGMMFPGKAFAQFFGKSVVNDEAAELVEHYCSESRKQAGKLDISLSYGSFAALARVAELTGLLKALQYAIPRLWKEVFALATHAVLSKSSTAQHFPTWAFRNWCGLTNPPVDSTISRIYSELAHATGSYEIFFELFHQEFHNLFPNSHERVIAFDSTNQVTESAGQKKAQRGKSKSGEMLPIVNTALYVDEITGISLWYEHFDGNVLDKSQTPYSLEKAQQLGFEKLFLMMDRGYYSEENARTFSQLSLSFGLMVPETVSMVSSLIADWKDTIKFKEERYIPAEDVYGIQTTTKLSSGDEYYAYVFFDERTAHNEYVAIHSRLNYFMSEASKRVRYSEKMREFYAKRGITVTKNARNELTGQNFMLTFDIKMQQQTIEEAGFFVILSNRCMTAGEMISIARKRDCAEKAFKDLKSHFGLSRTYTHTDETYCGKMFTAFVALVLLQSFRWFVRRQMRTKSSDTVSTLLGELEKYTIFMKKDGTFVPVYAMNKKQKSLFEALNLTEAQVEENVRHLTTGR